MQLFNGKMGVRRGTSSGAYLAIARFGDGMPADINVQDILFALDLCSWLMIFLLSSTRSPLVVTGVKLCIIELAPLVARILRPVEGQ